MFNVRFDKVNTIKSEFKRIAKRAQSDPDKALANFDRWVEYNHYTDVSDGWSEAVGTAYDKTQIISSKYLWDHYSFSDGLFSNESEFGAGTRACAIADKVIPQLRDKVGGRYVVMNNKTLKVRNVNTADVEHVVKVVKQFFNDQMKSLEA